MAPVAQHHLLDVADTQPIDEDKACAHLFPALDRLRVQLDGLTVLHHHHAFIADPGFARQL